MLELLQLRRAGLGADEQAPLAAAHQRRRTQIEYHPLAAHPLVAPADRLQRARRQMQVELTALRPRDHAHGFEQAAHRDGHLVFKAALAIGAHRELLAEPLQVHAAVGAGAAAHPQLAFEHLER